MVPSDRRESFKKWLKGAGIDADVHYPWLITEQEALRSLPFVPLIHGSLARAKEIASQEVSLPINPYLTNREVQHVIDRVNSWEV